MKCQRCGKELKDSTRCSFCGYDNFESDTVREMSNAEKNFYNGVTIDVSSNEKNNKDRRTNSEYTSYGQTTFVNFGGTGTGFNFFAKLLDGIFGGSLIAKILAVIIFLAFAAFMFFVALPIFFILVVIGIVVLVIVPRIKSKFFRKG